MRGTATSSRRRSPQRLLVVLAAVFSLLVAPGRAHAQDVWANSWRDVYDAVCLAETTDEQINIQVRRQFDRNADDPDIIMRGGYVVLDLDGFRISPSVGGQPAGNGRIITIESGSFTLQGKDEWSNGGLGGGSAELGGAILVEGGELHMSSGLIKDNGAQRGAGIAVMGGSCVIEGGTITGNSATQGGGVYVGPEGTLTVLGGTIRDNSADYGAGIYGAGGELVLSGGVVSGNSASVDGGGAYVGGGDFSLTGEAVLESNRASGSGGNLAVGEDQNGVALLEGGVIRKGSAANGGGVAALAGKFLFFEGEIVANSAACGGGVATLGGSVYLEGGSVRDNVASLKGGGAFVGEGTLCVWAGSVEANRAEAVDDQWGETATAEGGGIYVAIGGNLEVKGSPTIASNARGDNPQEVFLEDGVLISVTGAFTPPSAVGVDVHDLPALGETRAIATLGAYGADAFSCQAPDCEYVFESAGSGQGTALLRRIHDHEGTRVSSWADLSQRLRALARGEEASFWLDGDLTYGTGLPEAYATRPLEIRRDAKVTIDLNGYAINRAISQASQPSGEDSERCLYVSLGTLVIRDGRGGGRICGGCCQRGAGVFLAEGSLVLEGGFITGNKATYGAGVYVGMGTFEMSGGRIFDNLGLAQGLPCGAGVYVGDNSNLPQLESQVDGSELGEITQASMTMTGGSIDTNLAAGWGAGVCVSNGTLRMTDGSISSNSRIDGAKQGGGGIYACGASTVEVLGGSITNNQLTNKEGAGISVREGSTARLTDVAITQNYSNWDGGGVCAEASDLVIDGATINDNKTRGSGGGVVLQRGSTCRFDAGSINDNRANGCGAGMQVHLGASCTMTGGELKGNLAWSGNRLADDGSPAEPAVPVDETQAEDDASLGAEFSLGGAINVQGELMLSGGTITDNGAIIGSGICFDCEDWQREKGRLVVSGSPLITDNYLSWAPDDKEDITIYMGHDEDESARITVEGTFAPQKPIWINKLYRGQWEYVALADPGNYDMSAFLCAQGYDHGHTDYVLVKRDGVLYAYLHTHTWELHHYDKLWPDKATATCTKFSCPYFQMEAAFRLRIQGLADNKSLIPYDGEPHEAYLAMTDVPSDLIYTVDYSYYEGNSTSGRLLSGAPVDPGTYTATARLKAGDSEVTMTKTYTIGWNNGAFEETDSEQSGMNGQTPGNGHAVSQTTSGTVQKSKGTTTRRLPQTSDEPMAAMPVLALAGSIVLLVGLRQRSIDAR